MRLLSCFCLLFLLGLNAPLLAQNKVRFGVFSDSRDQTSYPMVQIDSVWWMNANLNFPTETSLPFSLEITSEPGRLYTYPEAQNICPTGWRLPSIDQFDDLINIMGEVTATGIVVAPKGWMQGKQGYGIWLFHKTGMTHRKRLIAKESYNFWLDSGNPDAVFHAHMYDVDKSDKGEKLTLFRHKHESKKAIRHKRKMAVRCVRK